MVKQSKKISNFIQLTHKIIEDQGNINTIYWIEKGTQFQISNIADFEERILPAHFKHSNMSSFIRQLNMYGFSKMRHQTNRFVFRHPFFVEGRFDLLHLIARKPKCKTRRQIPASKPSQILNIKKQNSSTSLRIEENEPCSIDIWEYKHDSNRLTSQQLINASSLSFNLQRKSQVKPLMLSKSILQFQKIAQQKQQDQCPERQLELSIDEDECLSIDQYLMGRPRTGDHVQSILPEDI